MFKRIISLLAALALCAGMLPVTALAEQLEETPASLTEEAERQEPEDSGEDSGAEPGEAVEPPAVTPGENTGEEPDGSGEDIREPAQEPEEPREEPEDHLEAPEDKLAPETLEDEPEQAPEDSVQEPPEEPGEPEILTQYAWIDGDDAYCTSDEAFAAYAQRALYGTDYTTFGTAAGALLTGNEKKVYEILAEQFRLVASGQRVSTQFTMGTAADGFAPEFPMDLPAELGFDLDATLDALRADLALEMYWVDLYNTAGSVTIRYADVEGMRYLEFTASVAAAYRDPAAEPMVVEYKDGSTKTFYPLADPEKTGAADPGRREPPRRLWTGTRVWATMTSSMPTASGYRTRWTITTTPPAAVSPTRRLTPGS